MSEIHPCWFLTTVLLCDTSYFVFSWPCSETQGLFHYSFDCHCHAFTFWEGCSISIFQIWKPGLREVRHHCVLLLVNERLMSLPGSVCRSSFLLSHFLNQVSLGLCPGIVLCLTSGFDLTLSYFWWERPRVIASHNSFLLRYNLGQVLVSQMEWAVSRGCLQDWSREDKGYATGITDTLTLT